VPAGGWRDGSVSVPKMSGLSIRSMEFNRRWGIAEQVKATGCVGAPQRFVYCTSMTGRARPLRRAVLNNASFRSPEPGCGCAQIFYDRPARKAPALPSVTCVT
jgi:hypothetical protein